MFEISVFRLDTRVCWGFRGFWRDSGSLPCVGGGGEGEGVEDAHVGDGGFEGDGDFGVVEDGAGEGVALESVLVDGGEGFYGDAGAEEVAGGVDLDARGAVGRGVEGDFELDAAGGAEGLDALAGDELGAAGEEGLAGGEVHEERGEAVDVGVGVAVDEGEDAGGFGGLAGGGAEELARGEDEVAADIHERAAAHGGLVADVVGVVVEVAEGAGDETQGANPAFADELFSAEPLRCRLDHEGFGDLDVGGIADGDEGSGFFGGEGDGLFAEDVLAGLRGFDGPGDVQVVGERIVDGVDVGVGEECFVGAVSLGNA